MIVIFLPNFEVLGNIFLNVFIIRYTLLIACFLIFDYGCSGWLRSLFYPGTRLRHMHTKATKLTPEHHPEHPVQNQFRKIRVPNWPYQESSPYRASIALTSRLLPSKFTVI